METEPGTEPPPFLSLRFHGRFFPALLWQRLQRRDPEASPFASHVPIEFVIALVVCSLVATGAAPAAWTGSATATVVCVLAAAGVLALLVQSIWTTRESRLTYGRFRVAVFVFCVVLGMTGALSAGRDSGVTGSLRLWGCAFVGAAAGYVIGIGAGLWAQRLGWIAPLVDVLAIAGTCGVAILAVILLL